MQVQLRKLAKGKQTPFTKKLTSGGGAKSKGGKGGGGNQKPPKQPNQEKPGWPVNNGRPKNPHDARSWSGTDWHHCDKATGGKCEGRWAAHDPEECKCLRAQKRKALSGKDKDKAAKKVLQAKKAVMDGDSSGSDSE